MPPVSFIHQTADRVAMRIRLVEVETGEYRLEYYSGNPELLIQSDLYSTHEEAEEVLNRYIESHKYHKRTKEVKRVVRQVVLDED